MTEQLGQKDESSGLQLKHDFGVVAIPGAQVPDGRPPDLPASCRWRRQRGERRSQEETASTEKSPNRCVGPTLRLLSAVGPIFLSQSFCRK